MNFKLLRAFVAVAETENIGQAAERLHISQSPLSRQIMQLETQLGLTLFERSRQRVRLTDEGRLFLLDAQNLLSQAERVKAHAHRLAQGECGTLAVGYVEAVMHAEVLPQALRYIRAQRPTSNVTLHALSSAAQVEALYRRAIDVGMLYSPPHDPDIQVVEIMSEPVILALASDHPLAGQPNIRADDLDSLHWIALAEARNPDARRRFIESCRSSGFVPDIQMEADDLLTALRLVGAGLGVTLVQSSLRDALPGRLTFRDLPWFPSAVKVYAMWRKDDPRPLVGALKKALSA
ncbi:LysR family transcriptional regulator [Pseudomonas sp. zjy_15]|uniref:LysR family transcriptional regulator n=1 Tax=unclassified Pseudomonas TaxID=196821 RepID=UPI00370BA5EE